MLYLPLQQYQPTRSCTSARRVRRRRLIARFAREVAALDKDLPLYAVKTLGRARDGDADPQRLLAYLVSGFGVLALLLAAIGLYGCWRTRSPSARRRSASAWRSAHEATSCAVRDQRDEAGVGRRRPSRAAGTDAADEEPAVRRQPARSVHADRDAGLCCSGRRCWRAASPPTARRAPIRRWALRYE